MGGLSARNIHMENAMNKRLIAMAGIIMMLLCLTSCQSAEERLGKLVHGVECIIYRCPNGSYYMIEKPQVNDEKDWRGLNLPLRKKWMKVETGESAGEILDYMLDDNEFLDAKVALRIKQESTFPQLDDLWDDDTISPEDVKALGLFEKDKCSEIAQYINQW